MRSNPKRKAARRDIEQIMVDGKAIDAAVNAAIRDALLDHKRAGNPIASWKDGKVVWIAAEDIPV